MHITKIEKTYKSAGIILFNDKKILILVDQKNMYDFPKGCKDENEKPLECALREAYEECSFLSSYADFVKNKKENRKVVYLKNSKLVFYLMESKYKNIEDFLEIKINPKTKIYEHKEIKFLTIQEIINKLELVPEYLVPIVKWIEKNNNDKEDKQKQ